MAYRAAVAALVACCALPAPASAAECVRLVVDYGTVDAQAPSSTPNTTCVAVADGSDAATAMHERAEQLDAPYPRYDGNFLCGIDGYPETGCGYQKPNPYWSLWFWADGTWVYSSFGMTDLTVADRDGDGHPDPLGFRFIASDGKAVTPRANPAYPKPAPATTKPTTPRPTTPGPPVVRTIAPGATTPSPATATARPTPTRTQDPTPAPDEPAPPSITPAAVPDLPRGDDEGFPVGAAAGGVLAAGLLAAAALRFRRTP